ncbi:MAG: flavodoxin family protein [Candidatus Helarchaeota archaeon]
MIKLLGINASHRLKERNTHFLLSKVLKAAERKLQPDVSSEIINLADKKIEYCNACYGCNNLPCPIEDDVHSIFEKMKQADVIVLGTPVYIYGVSSRLKSLIDRTRELLWLKTDRMALREKIGAAVVVGFVRNGGAEIAAQYLMHFFSVQQMIHAGHAIGISGRKGGVTKDDTGLLFAKLLGRNIANLAKNRVKRETETIDDDSRSLIEKTHDKIY